MTEKQHIPMHMPNETKEQRARRVKNLRDLVSNGQYPVNIESLVEAMLECSRYQARERDSVERRSEYMRNYRKNRKEKILRESLLKT